MRVTFWALGLLTLLIPTVVCSNELDPEESRGISLESSLVIDQSQPVFSSLTQPGTIRGLLDIGLTVDLSSLLPLRGGQLHITYQAHVGRDASSTAGVLQSLSTIDSSDRSQLAELWYEQWLLAKTLRFKMGRVDANSEFAFVETGAAFLNAALSTSPTISLLPTYPDPASGVNLFVYPHAHWYVGFGLYDGAGRRGVHTGVHGPYTLDLDDLFLIGEVGVRWTGVPSLLSGRLALGGWGHTGQFDCFTGGTQDGTSGMYLIFEQTLWREPHQPEKDEHGLAMFFQAGYTDRAVSEIYAHLSAGFTWSGLIPHRNEDIVGFGTTWVGLSPHSGLEKNDELALEFFYKWQFTSWLALQSDVQYFSNLAGGKTSRDRFITTVRLEFAFTAEGTE